MRELLAYSQWAVIEEKLTLRIRANNDGDIYLPTAWYSSDGTQDCDYSWKWNNGTKSWTVNFTTSWNLTYAETTSYNSWYVSFPISMWGSAYTISSWINITSLPSETWRWYSILWIWNIAVALCARSDGGGSNKFVAVVVSTKDWISTAVVSANTWYNVVWIFTTSWMKLYVNWTQVYSDSSSYSISWSSWKIFSRDALTAWDYHWKLSEVIIENRAWTADEIAEYYKQTKWNYGL